MFSIAMLPEADRALGLQSPTECRFIICISPARSRAPCTGDDYVGTSYLAAPPLLCVTDMLGVAARGVVESTRRFVVEYAREWQPADERSAARLSEALGRLSASINSHDVTLLEKPGGRCSLLKGTAPRWPFLAEPAWEECPVSYGSHSARRRRPRSLMPQLSPLISDAAAVVTSQAYARSATWRARCCGASSWRAASRST